MKKIMFLSLFICFPLLSQQSFQSWCDALIQDSCFTGALTAGFVFKHNDCLFKEVYGVGMVNVITADGCWYPWECWGFGAKISYWLAHGKTTFFKRHTRLQEVPVTFYARRKIDFTSGFQLYTSLGGGFVWIKENSCSQHVRRYKGIGEVEFGLSYPVWDCFDFTSAFRYLFPRQGHKPKKDVGGFDLRAGIGYSF